MIFKKFICIFTYQIHFSKIHSLVMSSDFKIYVNCDRCQTSYDSDHFEGEDCHNCTNSKCKGYLCLACIEDGKYICHTCVNKGFKDTSFDAEMGVEFDEDEYKDDIGDFEDEDEYNNEYNNEYEYD